MSVKIETKAFQQNMQHYGRQLKSTMKGIMQKSIVAYSTKAAVYLPPDLGKRSVAQKWYKRKIVYLPQQVQDHTNRYRKKDQQALKQGFLFRFIFKKTMEGKRYPKYFKTLRKAKEKQRIFNRGLFRFAMGGALQAIFGIHIPFFDNLIKKSPHLASLTGRNKVTESKQESVLSYKVNADVKDNERFAGKAISYGEVSYRKTFKRLWRDFNNKTFKV